MTAQELFFEWDNLSESRRLEAIRKLFDRISIFNFDGYNDFLEAVVETTISYEEDDYFGTEGLDI